MWGMVQKRLGNNGSSCYSQFRMEKYKYHIVRWLDSNPYQLNSTLDKPLGYQDLNMLVKQNLPWLCIVKVDESWQKATKRACVGWILDTRHRRLWVRRPIYVTSPVRNRLYDGFSRLKLKISPNKIQCQLPQFGRVN